MTTLSSLLQGLNKPTHIISYDLSNTQNLAHYEMINKKIKSLGLWAKPLNTFWMINSKLNCEDIKNAILSELRVHDKLLVVNISTGFRASYGLAESDLVFKLPIRPLSAPKTIVRPR